MTSNLDAMTCGKYLIKAHTCGKYYTYLLPAENIMILFFVEMEWMMNEWIWPIIQAYLYEMIKSETGLDRCKRHVLYHISDRSDTVNLHLTDKNVLLFAVCFCMIRVCRRRLFIFIFMRDYYLLCFMDGRVMSFRFVLLNFYLLFMRLS